MSTTVHSVVHEANNINKQETPDHFYKIRPQHRPYIQSFEQYQQLHAESINSPNEFFGRYAKELVDWQRPFDAVKFGSLQTNDTAWFLNGELNAAYNCVDRFALQNPEKPAIIYEADNENDNKTITYSQLLNEVCQVAAVLDSWGVKKGDTVAIYLPMIPAAAVAMLAVARLGAIHSVIFAGFSAGSIRDRVQDANCKVLITCNQGKRGGKIVHTKKIVDEALTECPSVEKCLIFQRTSSENDSSFITSDRDFWWHEEIAKFPGYFPCTPVDSEHPLFILYTSGSTGAPKGVVHSTAGYLLSAAMTTKYVFDVHPEDILFTAGDVGWITGHTYSLYGPLMLGTTSIIFESTPVYPDIGRYWRIIERHHATHFYVAPTALRLIKQKGEEEISKYDISSLRTLGSVGEPIAPDLWQWYNEKIGQHRCHISDTYWQTESGSHLIAPLAGAVPTKPGSATVPFFGIDAVIIDPVSGKELEGNDVAGVLAVRSSWPSMARTVYHNHERFIDTYLKPYPGFYFTGDGAGRDHDGYYWIRGRVDDVVNVSGHRLSTAEIEASILEFPGVAEGAVVGIHDELTGQAVVAYVAMKNEETNVLCHLEKDDTEEFKKQELALRNSLRMKVRAEIGPFAAPKTVIIVKELPKTRSGKIVRRVLRKIVSREKDSIGDLSSLVDPSLVEGIIKASEDQYPPCKI